MRFLFETYKQHHDQGIAAHKQEDYPKARMHYLIAKKYLCALAKEKDAEFKQFMQSISKRNWKVSNVRKYMS